MKIYLGKELPKTVEIVEVAPRDGLQNLTQMIPAETKKELLRRLAEAGVKEMEVTSFVHPKAIPQMADASEIASYAVKEAKTFGIHPFALVPNLRGAQSAWEAGLREVNYVISVSVSHNKANINRTHEQSIEELANIRAALPGMKINVALATVFGCPFEGEVTADQTIALIEQVQKYQIGIVTLSDTIGVATPLQVQEVITKVQSKFPDLKLGVHFHDTHGRALLNVWTALSFGVTRIETAGGGLGGCPFAPGAAGNLATEDLLSLLMRSGIETGIETGIDFTKYLTVVAWIRENIEPNLLSHLSKSRSYEELSFHSL